WEISLRKRLRKLTTSICSKIKEDYNIIFFNLGKRIIISILKCYRFDELIRDTLVITFLNSFQSIFIWSTDTINNKVVGQLYSFPPLIPIHGIIPADETC